MMPTTYDLLCLVASGCQDVKVQVLTNLTASKSGEPHDHSIVPSDNEQGAVSGGGSRGGGGRGGGVRR